MAECSICYEETKEVGEIACAHRFCYPCISTWAQTETSCPLCKVAFTSIRRKRLAEEVSAVDDNPLKRLRGTVLEELPVEQRRQHWQPEDLDIDLSELRCQVCGTDDDPAHLLLCDSCDRAAHTWCVGLDSVPTSDWHCPHCLAQRATREARRRAAALQRRAAAGAPAANVAAAGRHRSTSGGARQGRAPQRRVTAGAAAGRSAAAGAAAGCSRGVRRRAQRSTAQQRRQQHERRGNDAMKLDSDDSASASSGDGLVVHSEGEESNASASAEEVEVVGEERARAGQTRARRTRQQRGQRGRVGSRGGRGRSGGPVSLLRGSSNRRGPALEEDEGEYADSLAGSSSSSSAEERTGGAEDDEPEWEGDWDSAEEDNDNGEGLNLFPAIARLANARGRGANTRAQAERARRGGRGAGRRQTGQRQAATVAGVAAGDSEGSPAGSSPGGTRRNRSRTAARWSRRVERITQEEAALAAAARQGHASRTAERAAVAAAQSNAHAGEGLARLPSSPLRSNSSRALPSGTHPRTATRTALGARRFQQMSQRHRDVSAVEAMRTGGWQALREEEGDVINLVDSPSVPDSPRALGSGGRPEQFRRGVARLGHRRIEDDDDGDASEVSDDVPLVVCAQRAQVRETPSPSPQALPFVERVRMRNPQLQGPQGHIQRASSSDGAASAAGATETAGAGAGARNSAAVAASARGAGSGASSASAVERGGGRTGVSPPMSQLAVQPTEENDTRARSSSPDMLPLLQRLQMQPRGERGGVGGPTGACMSGDGRAAQTPAELPLLRAGGLIKDEGDAGGVGMSSLAVPSDPPSAVARNGGRSPYFVGVGEGHNRNNSNRESMTGSRGRSPSMSASQQRLRAHVAHLRAQGLPQGGLNGGAGGEAQEDNVKSKGSGKAKDKEEALWEEAERARRTAQRQLERRQQQQQQQHGISGSSRCGTRVSGGGAGALPKCIKEEEGEANSRQQLEQEQQQQQGRGLSMNGRLQRRGSGGVGGRVATPDFGRAKQPVPRRLPCSASASQRIKEELASERSAGSRDMVIQTDRHGRGSCGLHPRVKVEPGHDGQAGRAGRIEQDSTACAGPVHIKREPLAPFLQPWPQPRAAVSSPPAAPTQPGVPPSAVSTHPRVSTYPGAAVSLPPTQPQQTSAPTVLLPPPTAAPLQHSAQPQAQPPVCWMPPTCHPQYPLHLQPPASYPGLPQHLQQIGQHQQGQHLPQHRQHPNHHQFPHLQPLGQVHPSHPHPPFTVSHEQQLQQQQGQVHPSHPHPPSTVSHHHHHHQQPQGQVHSAQPLPPPTVSPYFQKPLSTSSHPHAAHSVGAIARTHPHSPGPTPTTLNPYPPTHSLRTHLATSAQTPQPTHPPALCHTPATAQLSHNTIIPATPSTDGTRSGSSPAQSQGAPGSVMQNGYATHPPGRVGHEQQQGLQQQQHGGTHDLGMMQQQQQQQQQQQLHQRALQQKALQQKALELQLEAWRQEQEYIEAMST